MKKCILFLVGLLFLTGCFEQKKFEVPQLTGRVVDISKTLSEQDKKDIEHAILNFEKNTGGQFAVCIVPKMYDETVETASMKVAEAWKLGQKGKDNGILFFLSMTEREFRIEVGYGFEGKLNDAKAGDLGRIAIPFFKSKKWTHGIIAIVNGCSDVLSGKATVEQVKKTHAQDITWLYYVLGVLAVILLIDLFINGSDAVCIAILLGLLSGNGSGGSGGSFGGGGFSGKF